MLHQMLYASGATDLMGAGEIDRILAVSRRNNLGLDVTGLLMTADGAFLQLLEGPEAAVRGLFERIGRDARHRNVMVLLERAIPERAFAGWSMGLKRLDAGASGDAAVFRATRSALDARLVAGNAALLNIVLAFGGRDFLAESAPLRLSAETR